MTTCPLFSHHMLTSCVCSFACLCWSYTTDRSNDAASTHYLYSDGAAQLGSGLQLLGAFPPTIPGSPSVPADVQSFPDYSLKLLSDNNLVMTPPLFSFVLYMFPVRPASFT